MIFERAAISIVTKVRTCSEKLVDQKAVGTVDLYPVEPRGDRISSSLAIVIDNGGNLLEAERSRLLVRLLALVRMGQAWPLVAEAETRSSAPQGNSNASSAPCAKAAP